MYNKELKMVMTDDGSTTLYRTDIDEHYHSTFGAVLESRHVYIESGLMHRAHKCCAVPIKVFEVGFGTGLNALLALETNLPIEYTAIEKFPLPKDVVSNLDFDLKDSRQYLFDLHNIPWEEKVQITSCFSLLKIKDDMTRYIADKKYDIIFMDAFAPEKQPEMWSEDMLEKLTMMLEPGGVLVTYCAKGHIRRLFTSLGLIAERLPGPPGGKREILRLSKPF